MRTGCASQAQVSPSPNLGIVHPSALLRTTSTIFSNTSSIRRLKVTQSFSPLTDRLTCPHRNSILQRTGGDKSVLGCYGFTSGARDSGFRGRPAVPPRQPERYHQLSSVNNEQHNHPRRPKCVFIAMAFKQEAPNDTLDIDCYLNYDQSVYPSPSISPSSVSRGKTIATPEFHVETPVNPFVPSHSSSQPLFPPPSHQYESYKQSTGLPMGALAHTLAVNQPNTFGFGAYQNYTVPPSDGYFGMNTGMAVADETFDFNSVPVHNPSFSGSVDMDMDFDSPLSDLFIPQASKSDYVNPSAIGGQEDMSPSDTPVQSQVGRLWPGMHQQQAALAKAQAQQRQQKARSPPQIVVPQPQPTARALAQSSRATADPIVEERISRLLNQMRQSSVSSSHDDDASTPTANQHHMGRQRKDEEDMDEDERLLASEEGKKLSSKERRQLRNKVSARAFRSRRKGINSSNFTIDYMLNDVQNISDNLKESLPSRQKRLTTFDQRTMPSSPRTLALPTSPACYSLRLHSLRS